MSWFTFKPNNNKKGQTKAVKILKENTPLNKNCGNNRRTRK